MAASTMASEKGAHESKSRDSGVTDEIMELVEAVKTGKLDRRAHAEKFDGDDRMMLEGINELVDAFMAPFNVTAEYVDRISKGDIPPTITDEYKGDFNEIKNNLNGLIQALKGLIDGAATMATAAAAGELETRLDASGFAGAWQTIVQGLNNTVEGVAVPVKDIGRVTDLIAAGDCSAKVTADYQGEYNKSKVAINALGDQIKWLGEQMTKLSEAAEQGDLDFRGDPSQFKGDIAEIVNGVNRTMEGVAVPVKDIGRVTDLIAAGDCSAKVTADYKGEYNKSKVAINALGDQLQGVQKVLDDLQAAIQEGKLDARGDASRFKGDIAKMVDGLNGVIEAFVAPINVTAEYVDRISKGDIPPTITDEYKGDFNEIKNNLNACIEVMNGLLAETNNLIQATRDGQLQTRGAADKFAGGWGELVGGINELIEAFVAPIDETAKVMEAAANKDLTAQIRADYKGHFGELKDNINRAMGALDNALSQVAGATGQVTGASGQIAAGSQTLAEGASEQASSLEEVTASIEEMTAMTQQNSSNATEANDIAGQARTAVDKGAEAMGRMSAAVDGIQKSSNETAKILKTIDEIAFQTNMLALNAAVEAARAGDAGKGFAVVAEEVRNLAQRSADAAKSTANMIDESVKNAKGGVEISKEVAGALDEIGDGIRKVGDLVGGIATASKEQAQGIEQINVAVGQMDQVTQAAAANAEQSASAAEELSAQAQELQAMTGSFKISNEATGAVRSSARPQSVAPKAKASPAKAPAKPSGKRNSKGAQPQDNNSKQAEPVAVAVSGGSSEEFMTLEDKNLSEF